MGAVLKRIFVAAALVLIGAIAALGASYWSDVREARAKTPELVRLAFEQHGRQVERSDLSAEQLEILLAIEDPAFYRHRGVDLSTPGAGMTTITQGLVKQLYFPAGFRPGIAKIRQTLLAQHALDAQVSKDEQLALYLNVTYFGTVDGAPVHGLAAAARTYFGKSYEALTHDEFAALIAMTIAPNRLKPGGEASEARMVRVKRYLAGDVAPASVLDFDYTGRTQGSFGEEALMALLRLLVDAEPRAR